MKYYQGFQITVICHLSWLQQPLNPLEECIRHIAEREIQPSGRGDYRTVVREHLERLLAVVGRHARCTYSAKRQLLVGNMHDSVIDTGTTRGGMLQHAADILLALAEVVQGQRLLSAHHKIDGFISSLEGHDRENRAEDFFLHNRTVHIHMVDDGRGDVALRAVVLATHHHMSILDVTHETIECTLVHDAHEQNPGIHMMLVNMKYPEYPVALGVIRDVDAPTYNDSVHQQIAEVSEKAKYHNFQELLLTNDTWEVK